MERIDMTLLFKDFAPVVGLIAAGYAMSGYLQLTTGSLHKLLRYAMFPALLFTLLATRVEPAAFAVAAGIGIAVTAAGVFLVRFAPEVLKPKVDPTAAIPNVASFGLPFLALGWMSVGMGTAAGVFAGAALATIGLRGDRSAVAALAREPWVYAVIAALACQLASVPTELASHVLAPLATAAVPVLLVFLGASMFPLAGVRDANAWATVGVRFAAGLAVSLAAMAWIPMTREVKEALLILAFAPPATAALAMAAPTSAQARGADASHRAISLGTLVALVAMMSLELVKW